MAATEYTLDEMRLDAEAAFNRAQLYHAELVEIYRYFMPWRLPTTERSGKVGTRSEGQRMGTADLFDATGLSAAASFCANMQADWLPSFQPLFKLEAGPLFDGDAGAYNKQLEMIGNIVHGLLPDARLAALEMIQDLFAGTGALFMEKGDKNRDPIRAVAVPVLEMAMENGPWGKIERWFWRRNHKARHLPQLWPEAKIEDDLAALIKTTPNVDVMVTQYTYWCDRSKRFQLRVWTNVGKTILREDDYAVTPWITPRLFVVPGESLGRGFAHLGLPIAKTMNKARELALRAAAFSLLGLWIRRHDGVFNPDTAVMAPGRMWKVAHTNGPMKSIERLDVPNNFDVQHVVMKDEREQLRRVLLDDEMPELADRVRSPTEITGRMRRYDRNRGGNTVRLGMEMVTPIARRGVDICTDLGLLAGTNIKVDNVITQVTVLSPAAVAARSGKADHFTSWMQIVVGLFGPQAAMMVAEVEKAIPDLGRWLGVEESHIRSAASTDQLKQMIAEYAAKLQQSDQAKPAQASAQVVPQKAAEAMYRNGGM